MTRTVGAALGFLLVVLFFAAVAVERYSCGLSAVRHVRRHSVGGGLSVRLWVLLFRRTLVRFGSNPKAGPLTTHFAARGPRR